MRYEPMIKVRLNRFINENGLAEESESIAFERFINSNIVNMHQPNATIKNRSLLEAFSVGGEDDMGIDGIGIKVNGIFVTTKIEIDDLIALSGSISIEILFIQSKYRDELNTGDLAKYLDGISDFLGETHHEPHNQKIADLISIKEYLFEEIVMECWRDAPIVRIYYAYFGEQRTTDHFDAKLVDIKQSILDTKNYCDVYTRILGSEMIKSICDENENRFTVTINVLGSLEFEEVEGVESSLVVLCKANDLIKILTMEEGSIRRSLFSDNVRDYQGSTYINQQMIDTIQNNPSNFLLLNNGITIVCSKMTSINRKVVLENPQIVNGCQTSNVLFHAAASSCDLSSISILAKIIATDQDLITNAIVKGTNSQNYVHIEAFEITREFHKELEAFIESIQADIDNKIYYERRSKQFVGDSTIKRNRICVLDTLAHSVVSIFLQQPHEGVTHIVKLLEKFQNIIFVDGQSYLPYYTSILLCLEFERLVRERKIAKKHDQYKFALIMLIAERIAGVPGDLNHPKIDVYCNRLILGIRNEEQFLDNTLACIELLEEIIADWVRRRGKNYASGIKDSPDFTKFLITYIRGGKLDKLKFHSKKEVRYTGSVISIKTDRSGQYFGFIKRYPVDIFFHQSDNPQINLSEAKYNKVSYKVITDPMNGRIKAIDVQPVQNGEK